MRINKVSCNHYAGLNGKKLDLTDGVNVVCENNEEGKSSIIDLMYQVLFTGTGDLSDEFKHKSFPHRVDGIDTEVVDGSIEFEKDGNICTVEKKWSLDNNGTEYYSDTAGAAYTDNKKILDRVCELLGSTPGVCKEIVFDSNRFKSDTIENLFGTGKDTQKNIKEVLQAAKDSSGRVTVEKIESLVMKQDDIFNKNWDSSKEEKIEKNKNAGRLFQVYQQLKTIEESFEKVDRWDTEKHEIYSKLDEKVKLRDEKKELLENFGVVTESIDNKEKLEKSRKELREHTKKKEEYLKAVAIKDKAESLKAEYEAAKRIEHYKTAVKKKTAYDTKRKEYEGAVQISAADIKRVNSYENKIDELARSGSGLNAVVSVEQLGDTPVQIRYLNGDVALEGSGEADIKQTVELLIPGVMKLTVAPKEGMDLAWIKEQIEGVKNAVRKDLDKFGVGSSEELDSKKEEFDRNSEEIRQLKADYDSYCITIGNKSWETIEAEYKGVPEEYKSADDMAVDAVEVRIKDLCGSDSIESFCGRLHQIIHDYEYGGIEDKISDLQETIKTLEVKVKEGGEIPSAYLGYSSSEEFTVKTKAEIRKIEDEIKLLESDLKEKNEAIRHLNDELRRDPQFSRFEDNYYDEIKNLKAEYEEAKREGKIWHDLRLIFEQVKAARPLVPHDGFDVDFMKYMTHIAGGSVSAAAMNDNLSVNVVSGVNKMSYEILSDGTAETVALAFRLAMLKNVFPDGGGFAIFDDPLVNMDDERKQRSIELIEEFAKDNQVIFVTCHNEYVSAFKDASVRKIEAV